MPLAAIPRHFRHFWGIFFLSVACILFTYLGLRQQAASPQAETWLILQARQLRLGNLAQAVPILIPDYMIGISIVWTVPYLFALGFLIADYDLRDAWHRRIYAALSLLFLSYTSAEVLRSLWIAIDHATWGFAWLAFAYFLWTVTLGCGVSVATGRTAPHLRWLLSCCDPLECSISPPDSGDQT